MDIGQRPAGRVMPIACSLPEEQERQRREELTRGIFARSTGTRDLDDGYEYAFPGDATLAIEIIRFILQERGCCRFLAFELTFEPDEGPITLRLRGPEGTREFLGRVPGGGA